jgi:hypothetical protein
MLPTGSWSGHGSPLVPRRAPGDHFERSRVVAPAGARLPRCTDCLGRAVEAVNSPGAGWHECCLSGVRRHRRRHRRPRQDLARASYGVRVAARVPRRRGSHDNVRRDLPQPRGSDERGPARLTASPRDARQNVRRAPVALRNFCARIRSGVAPIPPCRRCPRRVPAPPGRGPDLWRDAGAVWPEADAREAPVCSGRRGPSTTCVRVAGSGYPSNPDKSLHPGPVDGCRSPV